MPSFPPTSMAAPTVLPHFDPNSSPDDMSSGADSQLVGVIKGDESIGIVPSHCLILASVSREDFQSHHDSEHAKIEAQEKGEHGDALAPRLQEWNWKKIVRFGTTLLERDKGKEKEKNRGGFWGRGRDKDHQSAGTRRERESLRRSADDEFTCKIGFLTSTAGSEDWTLVLDVCDRASSSLVNAKEAVRALRREFKYGEPAVQLAAARLWAIMLRNSSQTFIVQSTSRKFLDIIENVITSPGTSPVVRERLLEVISAAAYASGLDKTKGFRGLWSRVRPPDTPEEGAPFDIDDFMFNPPFDISTTHEHNPNVPVSAILTVPGTTSAISDRSSDPPKQHRSHSWDIFSPEDIRRLFEECKIGIINSSLLSQLLEMAASQDFNEFDINDLHAKCLDSQELISTQIPWATAAVKHSRAAKAKNDRNNSILISNDSGVNVPTREEELLADLCASNEQLLEALELYDSLKARDKPEEDLAIRPDIIQRRVGLERMFGGMTRGRADLPPNIINAIIAEIDDVESLKACSLVASSLRFNCQCILLSTLTVVGWKCDATLKLLSESPHIPGYVTNLIVRLSYIHGDQTIAFRQISAKLRNLRRCTLDGQIGSGTWDEENGLLIPPPHLPLFALEFLRRQPLCELSLVSVRIPTSVLWSLSTAVPKLCFRQSVIPEQGESATVLQRPVLQSLILRSANDLGQYIARPENRWCLAALRHLSISSSSGKWAEELIEAVSSTIEHINFDCPGVPPLNLPHLPALRTLQLTFFVNKIIYDEVATTTARPEILSKTADILSSLMFPEMFPALVQVKIDHWEDSAEAGVLDPAPYIPLIARLESALESYSTPPSIHWILIMNNKNTVVAHFADTVRRAGCPKLTAQDDWS
ncbi:hypothetical protein MSAN_00553900 [Mycena sanguinolenta]|uniref:VHS domain-containing protein n=1 Tax=Mycena sanguinolenta TaxID=230812 RepID=A0A8H6Z9I7_9AGAR|nr:hypothetical protein MSAN_00553900 [Mycena sanguinolenta]